MLKYLLRFNFCLSMLGFFPMLWPVSTRLHANRKQDLLILGKFAVNKNIVDKNYFIFHKAVFKFVQSGQSIQTHTDQHYWLEEPIWLKLYLLEKVFCHLPKKMKHVSAWAFTKSLVMNIKVVKLVSNVSR